MQNPVYDRSKTSLSIQRKQESNSSRYSSIWCQLCLYCQSAELALFVSDRNSSIVLESGSGTTYEVPIYGGCTYSCACTSEHCLNIASRDMLCINSSKE